MTSHLRHWVQLAALLIWLAAGLPVLATDLVVAPHPWWWAAYLAYGALLAVPGSSCSPSPWSRWGGASGGAGRS